MVIKIPEYALGYKICSLAKDKNVLSTLLKEKLEALYIYKDSIYYMPEKIKVSEDRIAISQFSECDNYDVFEISPNGCAYQYYNNESNDNAFIITGKCNSNCIMCPAAEIVRKNGNSIGIDNLLKLVNHIPSDASHFTITGGEPFLIGKSIFLFFESLKNKFKHTEFLLLTNGRIFSVADYCNMLKKTMPKECIIGIPLHGFDSKTHDAITQAEGSFDQTVIGIKNLISLGFHVEIRIVVSQITATYIEKIARYIVTNFPNAFCVKIMGLEMLGNAAINKEKIWIPYAKAFEASLPAIDLLIRSGIDVGLYNFPLCSVDKNYWNICSKSISDSKVRYTEKCNTCLIKDACGGIFAGSYRLASQEVLPFAEI